MGSDPGATPTYEVKEYEDLALVYAVEYDLELEFDNLEDMNRFDEVIKTYAKKNEGNEEAKGPDLCILVAAALFFNQNRYAGD